MAQITYESNAAYHADLSHISNSMLQVYRKSIRLYHGRFITKTVPAPEPTLAMMLGSLVHSLYLEPELFDERYIVAPCERRSGEMWKKAVDEAEETGKEAVPLPLVEKAIMMSHELCVDEEVNDYRIFKSRIEHSIRWEDESGLKLKCRPDLLIEDNRLDSALCIEVKTSDTWNRDGFRLQIYNLGYHRQAALELAGCKRVVEKPLQFIFFVIGSTIPHDVFVYRLDPSFIRLGEIDNIVTLSGLARSMERDEWVRPKQQTIETIEPLPWMLKE